METRKPNKGGRPALADPAKHRHVLYLNERENARFLSQWEQSGVTSKSRFIAARIFGEPFRVVKVDKSAVEYCARLTEFYVQFRAVAVNYNQVVKALHSNFSEKKALAFLYKLEKATTEIYTLSLHDALPISALADPAKHRHVLYLNDRENARFLSQWEQSGVTSKSRFIAARLFGEPFRVVKVDKSAVEYCARLTEFYAQFRAVAVNYNQVVKALHSNFSEKKALAFLYKLEKATTELSMLNRQVIDLTNECKELWLPK